MNGERGLDLEARLQWIPVAVVAVVGITLGAGLVAHVLEPGGALSARLLQLGLVLLMIAPAARLLIALAERLRRRDWLFVAMTLIVTLELAVVMWRASQKI